MTPKILKLSISDFFPFDKIRPEQSNAINFALDQFINKKKKFVILEMGPGCGKSATAITIARYLQASFNKNINNVTTSGTYFLTTQKILQEQYIKDFGNDKGPLRLLKSSNSYTCHLFKDQEEKASCGQIQRLLKSEAEHAVLYNICKSSKNSGKSEHCKYLKAKTEFKESIEGILNYSYFLTAAAHNSAMPKQGLLVLDEAHNIDSAISNQVKVSFSNFFYKRILEVRPPNVNAGQKRIYKWLVDTVKPRLKIVIRDEIRKLKKSQNSVEAVNNAKKLESLRRSYNKIEHFISVYDPKSWVLDSSKTDKRGERIYEFKPVEVGKLCQKMLYSYADKVLILSATILDKDMFCKTNGIKQSQAAFLKIPSPFPAKNRPIHILPVGSMSRSCIDTSLPVLAEMVKELLQQHANEKGIIHTVNYRIAKYLTDYLDDSRLLIHTTETRNSVIELHNYNKEPTVLLSPSMTEGVDLEGNKSRFQILCKVPFPYLGDAVVRKRMEKDKDWYNFQTVKCIVQAFGRSIRNKNDHAISYILDSDWNKFYRKSKKLLPDEFLKSIINT